ncbi:hypothetical protein HBNCFIEN_00671 [Legionella sp. PC997]|nr:hypothetical protein HBNCFIEN_00671 [Legionella sp. PC997]
MEVVQIYVRVSHLFIIYFKIMSFYKLIADHLNQSGFYYEEQQLQRTDIIEYMVLESAGALHPLQGKPLKCIFRQGHTSNILFRDNKRRSALEFGLNPSVKESSLSEDEKTQFIQIVNRIEHKFPESTFDSEHYFYNSFHTLYSVILPDDNIEFSIKSSSLFVAAGNLLELDLEALLLLRKKLAVYKIADNNLSVLVDRLVEKINNHLSEHFEQRSIQQTLPKVEEKFAAMLAIEREEHKFNQLLQMLKFKLHELADKGTKTYEPHTSDEPALLNDNFDPNYSTVAPIAQLLGASLLDAGTSFFNNPLSQKSFTKFKQTCHDSIQSAKEEFGKYRGWAKWYNELNPILKSLIICVKAIGGIIAGLTIAPGILTALYCEQGYLGTFFNTKTDSLRKLESFEKALVSKGGIFDELNKEIPHVGMALS